MTLEQLGARLVDTYKHLTPEQRQTMTFEELIKRLRVPVGMLK